MSDMTAFEALAQHLANTGENPREAAPILTGDTLAALETRVREIRSASVSPIVAEIADQSDTYIAVEVSDMRFVWHGGEYVEISLRDNDEGWEHPHDVINLWDYETGSPRIPYTPNALERAVAEWIAERQED
jgi:hypothetical protein